MGASPVGGGLGRGVAAITSGAVACTAVQEQGAAQRGDEADKAKPIGALQLIPSVRRTWEGFE